jgi:superkiller protein 3
MRAEAWAEAAKRFQLAINIDPKFALAYYSLGRAHASLKQFTEAIKAYSKCRELYLARAGEQFSDQMSANRARDEQILQYREAVRQASASTRGPRSETPSLYQLRLTGELRQLEEAKQRNTSVAFEMKVPFYVSLALGAAYFRSELFADAEREYKAALDDNPNSGETHNNLAVLYLMTNRFEEASKAIAMAERTGYKVNPGLKDELAAKQGKGGASPR